MNTNSMIRNYRLGQTMKITPISDQPSVAVAVVADEENVIATKNDFDNAPLEEEEEVEASPRSLSSSSKWIICVVASVIALVAVVATCIALPLVATIETEEAPLQITFDLNHSINNETRIMKRIISNGQYGICSIDEHGYSITYTPNEGFFGSDTCTYTVIVCSDTDVCDDDKEETIKFLVADPDAPVTSPDAIVLVGEEISARSITTTPANYATTTTVPTTATADSVCTECSITNGEQNFCGELGIRTLVDACESQTECKERGLECIVCNAVDGFDGDVGSGAYVCVEEEEADAPSTTSASTHPSSTTTKAIASGGGIEILIETKWKAMEIMWFADSSSEELKETTEEDRHPITLLFDSDTRASGYCGNNRYWSKVSLRTDRLMFDGFGRTRMVASEQENNYVHLLQENEFFYEVLEGENGLLELHLYEILIEDDLEKRGRLMATYVQDDEQDV
ncbi:hypothetical protein ACHAXM_002712 [Skeletonema potamos]